jgi:hypothetical protein
MFKRTTEEVAKYFEDQGCKLLGEYTGAMKSMEYQCSCGRLSKMSWNNFTKGKRCGWCGERRNFKYTFEEVKEIFSKHGCELLDKEYKNHNEPLNYLCKCGTEAMISLSAVMHQKQHCKKCGIEKYRISRTKPDSKNKKKISYKYRKSLKRTLLALKLNKTDYSHKMLGYTAKELYEHITNHPNWDSVKDADWQLDHIFPVDAFIKHGITDIKLINGLDNLQPLSKEENRIKSNHCDDVEFSEWLGVKNFKSLLPNNLC